MTNYDGNFIASAYFNATLRTIHFLEFWGSADVETNPKQTYLKIDHELRSRTEPLPTNLTSMLHIDLTEDLYSLAERI